MCISISIFISSSSSASFPISSAPSHSVCPQPITCASSSPGPHQVLPSLSSSPRLSLSPLVTSSPPRSPPVTILASFRPLSPPFFPTGSIPWFTPCSLFGSFSCPPKNKSCSVSTSHLILLLLPSSLVITPKLLTCISPSSPWSFSTYTTKSAHRALISPSDTPLMSPPPPTPHARRSLALFITISLNPSGLFLCVRAFSISSFMISPFSMSTPLTHETPPPTHLTRYSHPPQLFGAILAPSTFFISHVHPCCRSPCTLSPCLTLLTGCLPPVIRLAQNCFHFTSVSLPAHASICPFSLP